MPRYDILSEDAMAVLERGWRRLLSDVGVEFLHDESLERFRAAGQRVEGSVVKFDPDWIMECVASAPGEFDLVARNPERTVHLGGRHMVFSPTQGPPFVREGDERREATMADFENLCRLSQTYDQLDTPGGLCCEPGDRPLDSRHLDMLLAVQTLTDKPYMGAVITEGAAVDTIRMTDMLFGGAADDQVRVFGVVNANSPIRYDTRMIEAMVVYAAAGQAVIITPFLLMGAMSPASVPGSLVQQTAESLAGLALLGPGRAPPRGAVAGRRRLPHVEPDRGCPGRLRGPEHDAAGVPGGRELRGARGRLARVGPGRLLREVHRRHRDAAHAPGGVHAARDRRGQPGLRRAPGGRPRRSLPGRGAHAGALPHLLLPAASVLDGELRAVEVEGRARRRRPRRRDLAGGAGRVRAAAARRRPPGRARGLRRPPPRGARRLKITAVRAYRQQQPFADGAYSTAGGSAQGFDSLIVAVDTDEGVTGWGEMAPLGAFYADAFASGARAGIADLAPSVLGADPCQPRRLVRRMDSAMRGQPYVKSALDMACW